MELVYVKCPHCGKTSQIEPSKDAAICKNCGEAFVVERAKQLFNKKKNCPHCGAKIFEGCEYCFACGRKVSSDKNNDSGNNILEQTIPAKKADNLTPLINEPSTNNISETIQQEKCTADVSFCHMCGGDCIPGELYCVHCGTIVKSSELMDFSSSADFVCDDKEIEIPISNVEVFEDAQNKEVSVESTLEYPEHDEIVKLSQFEANNKENHKRESSSSKNSKHKRIVLIISIILLLTVLAITLFTGSLGHLKVLLHKWGIQPDHSYGTGVIIKDSTCIETGTIEYTCLLCGEKSVESLNEKGHSFVNNICSVCGDCASHVFNEAICVQCGIIDPEYKSVHIGGNFNYNAVIEKGTTITHSFTVSNGMTLVNYGTIDLKDTRFDIVEGSKLINHGTIKCHYEDSGIVNVWGSELHLESDGFCEIGMISLDENSKVYINNKITSDRNKKAQGGFIGCIALDLDQNGRTNSVVIDPIRNQLNMWYYKGGENLYRASSKPY